MDPFFVHVRPAIHTSEVPPSVLTAPVRFTDGVKLVLPFGTASQVRVETTFPLPRELPVGEYSVVVCNAGCKKGIGDLIGGPLFVGVDAPWPINRNWPSDDPSFARSQAQPPERRSPATVPSDAVVPRPTIASAVPERVATTRTTVESIAPPSNMPAAAPQRADRSWAAWIVAATATAVTAAGAVIAGRAGDRDMMASGCVAFTGSQARKIPRGGNHISATPQRCGKAHAVTNSSASVAMPLPRT